MAQATVDLGLNTSQFAAGLSEAERKSQTFEGRISGLFKRSPLHRAERAFSDFAANLATGNVAQAIAGFAGRLTGLGLILGAGVGAGTILFQKFKGQIDATSKSVDVLFGLLSRPLSAQSGLSSEGIQSQISAYEKAINDLSTKRQTLGSRIAEGFERRGGAPAVPEERRFGIRDTGADLPAKQTRAQEALEASFRRIHALRLSDVETEKALVNVHALATQFSEKEAALEKNRLDAQQKRAALRLKFGGDPREAANLHAELQNITRDEKLSADEIERKASLKERELDIDRDIAGLAARGVSAEDQKIAKLERELSLIQEQLAGAESLTTENRKQLQTAEAKTQAELAAARVAASGRPVLSPQDIRERAKLSLADIAANATQATRLPFNLADEQRFGEQATKLGPAAIARQALREEEFARQAALRGNLPLSETLLGMSDKLREQIPALRNAEKPISMADALKEYGKGPEIVTELKALKAKMDTYWGQ